MPLVLNVELTSCMQVEQTRRVKDGTSSIPRLIHETIFPTHTDDRRSLSILFDHQLQTEDGRMEGRIIEVLANCTLGGWHVHGHNELFTVLKGQAKFTLYNEDYPEIRETRTLIYGQRLMIPKGVAHSVSVEEDTTLFAISERLYSDSLIHTRQAKK